jgi:hypothetical protein
MQSVKAMLYSSRCIDFGEMILIATEKPSELPSSVRFVKSDLEPTFQSSCVCTYTIVPYLTNNDYLLSIHDDGFVINPHLWDDNFLNYDYIGAPWKNEGQRNRVGNGGFVLRSKKFLDLVKNLKYLGKHDDGELTNDYYDYFTGNGCVYAPVELAMRFSLESKIPECAYDLNNCFGFHGKGDPIQVRVHDGEYQQFQMKCRLLDEYQTQ